MNSFLRTISSVCFSVFLYICSFFGTISLTVSWIPCYIYRKLVVTYVKLFKPQFRPINNFKSVTLSDDDIYENPSNCSIVAIITLQSLISLQEVSTIVKENLLNATIHGSSIRRYPELQEAVVSLFGYPFFKRDYNFSLTNHIAKHDKILELKEERDIHEIMLNMPFLKHKSPWRLILFPGTHPMQSILALKLHHCLGDGISVVKLLVEGLGGQRLETSHPKFIEKSATEDFKYFCLLPFKLVSLNAYLFGLSLQVREHPWLIRGRCDAKSSFNVAISEKIDLTMVKQFAKILGVQTSTVFINAICVAMKRYMSEKHKMILKDLPIYLALPKQSHPSQLSNHLYIGIPAIPLLNNRTREECLLQCNKVYTIIREGDEVIYLDCMGKMLAALPKPIRSKGGRLISAVTSVSNIAGEQLGLSIGGHSCSNISISTGLPQGSIGIGFTILSYKNQIQVGIVSRGSILTKEDTEHIKNLMEHEFRNLYTLEE